MTSALLRRTAEGSPACLEPRASGITCRLGRDDALAQFARFVLVGGVSSALYALLFVALAGLGDQPANLAGGVRLLRAGQRDAPPAHVPRR
jgi:hypothetical protein